MKKNETIISTIWYIETGIDYIRRYETKEIDLGFALVAIEVQLRKAKKNLEWLAIMGKDV